MPPAAGRAGVGAGRLDRRVRTEDRREAALAMSALVLAGGAGSTRSPPAAMATAPKRALAIAVGALSAAVVGLVLVHPAHLVDSHAWAGVEVAIALSALLSASLLGSHLYRVWRLHDVLLLAALAMVSLTDVAFGAVPGLRVANVAGREDYGRLGATVVVALVFAALALAPDRRIRCQRRGAIALAAIAAVATVGLGELFDFVSGASGGSGVRDPAGLAAASHAPLAQTMALVASGVLLLAGIAFVRRIGRTDGDAWLVASVCFLLSAGGLQPVAAPAVVVDWITPGDGLRLAAYGILLAVAARRYRRARREAAWAALDEERQRIARDLHDGLAQDLAFIGLQAQALDSDLGAEHPLMVAARSALAVSRGMIVDLAARSAPSTAAALRLVTAELELRFGVQAPVRVMAGPGGLREPAPAEREQLVRIAREAIVNAVRHGGAQRVEVVLDCRGTGRWLLVSDDGSGITESALRTKTGSGLATMEARAESLGGRLRARPGAHGGTELEVLVGAAPEAFEEVDEREHSLVSSWRSRLRRVYVSAQDELGAERTIGARDHRRCTSERARADE